MICKDVLTCLLNLDLDVLVMRFAHVPQQCEKDLMAPIKHLEFRFELRRDRQGVTAVVG